MLEITSCCCCCCDGTWPKAEFFRRKHLLKPFIDLGFIFFLPNLLEGLLGGKNLNVHLSKLMLTNKTIKILRTGSVCIAAKRGSSIFKIIYEGARQNMRFVSKQSLRLFKMKL